MSKTEDALNQVVAAMAASPKPVTMEQAQLCLAAAERVVNTAAEELDLRPRQVARRFRRGARKDAEITTTVLRLAAVESVSIDPENLRAILEVILEFIKALMSIFT